MPQVVDYSGWRPTAADIRLMQALGYVGCSRYLAQRSSGDWKRLTKGEYDFNLSLGWKTVLNFEEYATRAGEGYDAGYQDGSYARWYARNVLGHPDSRPIIQSVDFGVAPSMVAGCLAYHRGFNDGGGCGPQPMYGGTYIIDIAWREGITHWGWQAMASSWSPHPSHPAVALKQLLAKPLPFPANLYDANEIIRPDWGQHPYKEVAAMAAPFTLWQEPSGVVWRVDPSYTVKVRVTDVAQLEWNQALLTIGGHPNGIMPADHPTKVAWLAGIPVGGATLPPPVDLNPVLVAVAGVRASADQARDTASGARSAAEAAMAAADGARTAVGGVHADVLAARAAAESGESQAGSAAEAAVDAEHAANAVLAQMRAGLDVRMVATPQA
jgi:hypothetical protein